MSYIEFPQWITYLLYSVAAAACVYFIYIVYNYKRGLKTSPREIWFVSISQIIEYTAYSVMLMTLTLFLSSDLGLRGACRTSVYQSSRRQIRRGPFRGHGHQHLSDRLEALCKKGD